MAMYLLAYLTYTGLKKLTEGASHAVKHLQHKVKKEKDVPKEPKLYIRIPSHEAATGGWYARTEKGKFHYSNGGYRGRCGISLEYVHTIMEDPDEDRKCKSCVRIQSRQR